MPKAIRFYELGGPEVLKWEEATLAEPGPRDVLLRQTAIGVNFIDSYHRTGLYPVPLPSGLGSEGAGVIESVGAAIDDFRIGDRVAYAGGPIGSYAELRVLPADRLVKIPAGISDEQAAGMMLKGMTVQYLIRRTYAVQPGDTVLFHAAAGGVGSIACQWLKALGAIVIGTVGSSAKAELARQHGCQYVIDYTREDFAARVKEITSGRGVPVVYDSVGRSTFPKSLDCLQPRGLFVSFGNASGPVPAFELSLLAQKGSLFATRPSLADYTATRSELEKTARDLFDVVLSGKVRIEVQHRYHLEEAAQVHRDLEARKTTGSVVMLPSQ